MFGVIALRDLTGPLSKKKAIFNLWGPTNKMFHDPFLNLSSRRYDFAILRPGYKKINHSVSNPFPMPLHVFPSQPFLHPHLPPRAAGAGARGTKWAPLLTQTHAPMWLERGSDTPRMSGSHQPTRTHTQLSHTHTHTHTHNNTTTILPPPPPPPLLLNNGQEQQEKC